MAGSDQPVLLEGTPYYKINRIAVKSFLLIFQQLFMLRTGSYLLPVKRLMPTRKNKKRFSRDFVSDVAASLADPL